MTSGSPIIQTGTVTPGHVVVWQTDGIAQDAGPATAGIATEFGITKNGGLAFGINSGAPTGPYLQLAFGASSNGTITVYAESYNGAPQADLVFNINGQNYPFVPSGSGNVSGPSTSTVGDLVSWANSSGRLISDTGIQASAIVQGPTVSVSGDVVAFSGTTGRLLQDTGVVAASLTPAIATIAALRASTASTLTTSQCLVLYYATPDDGGGGVFIQGVSGTDDGGTIINDSSGRSWYRVINGQPYSVAWFGATGLGVVDDSVAIQDAYTATGLGGQVYYPTGTYLIKNQINVTALSGTTSGIQSFGSRYGSIITPGATLTTMFNVTGDQVNFNNLRFINASNFATTALTFTTPQADTVYGSNIDNNVINGFTNGILISGPNYGITRNYLNNNTNSIVVSDNGNKSFISQNYIENTSIGILLQTMTQSPTGIRITDNSILPSVGIVGGVNGKGIAINSGVEIFIGWNIISNVAAGAFGISASGTSTGLKMIGNFCSGGTGAIPLLVTGTSSNVHIIGNSILPSQGTTILSGIEITGANGYSIISNNFYPTTGGSPDITISSSTNGNQFGNMSTNTGSNAIQNFGYSFLAMSGDLTSGEYIFNSTVTMTSGPNPPSTVQPAGSVYFRTPGALGQRLYISQGGGAWTAVAGV
jgi:hypothetical protein